jgi:hypothetical protein
VSPPATRSTSKSNSTPPPDKWLFLLNQREYVTWIEEAKRAETRRRRIAKAVEMLREGRTQRA